MKITTEGIFDATITSQDWEFTPSGKPVCKIGFNTAEGDAVGSFFFDQDQPKFGTETGLQKNSRAFAAAIPGWTPAEMDRPQTYVGAKVAIRTKYNQAGFLNVNGIFPVGYQGGGQKLDTAGDAMARIRAAAKIAAAGITPPPSEQEQGNDFTNEGSIPF